MSLLQRLFLEEPGTLIAVCAIAGLVLLVLGNQRAQRKLLRAGLIVILAGLVLWGLATLVVTSRERLQKRTQALLDATAPLDTAALRDILDSGAVLTVRRVPYLQIPRDEIISNLEDRLRQYRVESHSIDLLDARTDGDAGQTYLRVGTQVESEFYGGPVHTTWDIRWRRDGSSDGQWRIISMEFVELQNQDPPADLVR